METRDQSQGLRRKNKQHRKLNFGGILIREIVDRAQWGHCAAAAAAGAGEAYQSNSYNGKKFWLFWRKPPRLLFWQLNL